MIKMIGKLDESIKENLDYLHSKEIELQITIGNNALPKRTRYELENLLYVCFDIHKKHYRGRNFRVITEPRSPHLKAT